MVKRRLHPGQRFLTGLVLTVLLPRDLPILRSAPALRCDRLQSEVISCRLTVRLPGRAFGGRAQSFFSSPFFFALRLFLPSKGAFRSRSARPSKKPSPTSCPRTASPAFPPLSSSKASRVGRRVLAWPILKILPPPPPPLSSVSAP